MKEYPLFGRDGTQHAVVRVEGTPQAIEYRDLTYVLVQGRYVECVVVKGQDAD